MNLNRIRISLWLAAVVLISGCQPQVPQSPAPANSATAISPTMTSSIPASVPEATYTPTHVTPALGDRITRTQDRMEMVFVPGGEFIMGSDDAEVEFALEQCRVYGTNCAWRYFSVEIPPHPVRLDSYWLDLTEVTSGQFQKCVDEGACVPAGCTSTGEDYPAICVPWHQAAAYCQWVDARLPSEAEWEYAARGSGRSRYPWGDDFDGNLLNYCDSSCGLGKRDPAYNDGYAESAPVGSYPLGASWVGALDMAGNVWEMVADWNGNYPQEAQVNPPGPETGSRKVARGGSWHASPDHVRSALRTHMAPSDTTNHVGFRCAQSVK